MKTALIIPLYNKARYVQASLASVLAQTHRVDELWIIDDHSDDGSVAVVEDYLSQCPLPLPTQTRVQRLDQNLGPGAVKNLALDQCDSELVMFLDADDCLAPEYLGYAQQLMGQHQLSLMISQVTFLPQRLTRPDPLLWRDQLQPLAPGAYRLNQPLLTVTEPEFILGVGNNVVAQRHYLQQVRFAEQVRLNENVDFWFRVLKQHHTKADFSVGLNCTYPLQVQEVPGSLSRQVYSSWQQVEYPVLFSRYQHSDDPYERRLMRKFLTLWAEHALQRLPDDEQKHQFVQAYTPLYQRFSVPWPAITQGKHDDHSHHSATARTSL